MSLLEHLVRVKSLVPIRSEISGNLPDISKGIL
jgi:hypothetical protein